MTEQRKRPKETLAGDTIEMDAQTLDGSEVTAYEMESPENGSLGNGFAAIPVQERFQSVLESIEDGYYETDLKGNVQFFNPRMAAILGHPPEELLGANYRQYTAPECVEEVFNTFNRVYQTGEPVKGFVWEFITKDGRRGFIETSTSLIRNAKGEPIGFRGIGRDVTDRMRSEAKLGHTLAEIEQLYQLSTRLNQATTPEEMLHNALLPSLGGKPSAITLYAVKDNDEGRPVWAEVLTHWSRVVSDEQVNPTPGERLNVADFPAVRQWAEEPCLPLLMGDVAITAFLDESGRAAYAHNGTAAAAIVPLKMGSRWIGLITINWPERQLFTDSDARFYRSLAEQAAAQLHSHLLLAQVEKRAQALATVTEVSTAVTTILDVETLLQMVVARTKESFDLYHAHIYLLDELGEYLVLRAGWGEPGRQMVAEGHAISFFHEHSIVARTAREGVPTIVNDVTIEPDFLPNPLLPDTRSEMAIPIIVGGLVLGVLDVQADRAHFFQEGEVQVLMALASQLAVALHNAQQFQETQQRTLELEETSSVLDKVLENLPVMLFMKEAEELRIVRWNKAAEEITGHPSYTLLGKSDKDLFPAEQAEFFNKIDREVLNSRVPIDIPQEPIDTVHQGRRILHTRKIPILDIHGNPRYLLGISEDITEQIEREQALLKQAAELDALNRRLTREGWQSYLQQSTVSDLHLVYEGTGGVAAEEPAVHEVLHQPLNVRGEMVGELTLDSPQVLNEEAAEIIEAVAERLAIHLENLRLTEQTEQALAESEKRARYQANVARAVATLTEEGTAGIPEALRLLGEASQVSRVIYFDVYKDDEVVYWRYHAAWYDPNANLMAESLAPWELPMEARPDWLMALQSGSPLTGFTSQMPPEVAHLLERFGIQSTLVLPVPSGEATPGCITFDETRFEREWGEDEISALLTAASAIGNTVQRENLHRRIETSLARTEALYRAGQAMLRHRDLDDLLRTVTDEIVKALNADRVASLLFDEGAQRITHFVCAGPGREQIVQPSYEALHSGLSGRVLQQGEAVLSPQETEAEGGSMMVVPLVYRNQRFGTITAMNRPEQRTFDHDDLGLLSAVARQAAVAIENSNLLTQTQQQLSDLSTLQQMAGRLAATVSLKEAIGNILPLLVTASNADFASLFRIEGQQGVRMGVHPVSAEEDGFKVGETFPLSNYPQLLQVVRSKEAVALSTDDPRLTEHARETFQSIGVKAVATVPIINRRGQVWGVFTLSSRAEEFPFSPALMGLLKTMADQASIALERAESFQQTEQALAETEAMYAGSALVGQADSFQATLHALVTATALRYLDHAHLMFFDEVWSDTPPTGMEVTAAWARPGESPYFPVGKRLTAAELPFLKQMRRDIPTYLADVRTDTRLTARTRERLAEELGMVTVAMFPLIAGGNCFGVLTAQAHRPHALSDTELRRIANLTDQASSVIQNLRLFAEARMHADELSILNDMAKALASELSVEDTIRNVYHYTGKLLNATDAYIALYDEATDEVDIKILGEGEIVVESALKRRGFNGITEYVLHNARPLLIHEDVPRVARELGVEVVGRPAQSWLGVPMMIGTRRLGIIAVQDFENTYVFDEHDQELLTAVASQTAISLQNAYLLERTQQALAEARTLYDVSASLNAAITLEETLQAAIAPARENGATSAILWTYDYAGQPEPQWQEIVATWDVTGAPMELEQKRFRIADIPIAQLWRSTQNEPVFLSDPTEGEPAATQKALPPAFQATMVMPLYTGRRQVGLITIRWPEARTFSAAEQRLYRSIAAQTAEVVEGRLLLQAAQERTSQLELLSLIEADLSQVENETDIVRSIVANFEDIPAAVLYYVDVDEANRPKYVRAVARWADHMVEALDGIPRLPAEEPLAPLWLSHPHDILMIEDTHADKRLTQEQIVALDEMGARALTIAPFYSGGRWQGNMLLFWPQPFKFTETHRFVFRRLLEPVAAIITSRRAQLAQQAALDETERLYQAIAALNAAQTYEEILDVMRNYTDAGKSATALSYGQFDRPWTDSERPEWAYVKARWSQVPVPNTLSRYRLADIPVAERLMSGDPFVLEDIATDPRLDDASRKALYGPAMMRSAIFIPLLYAGRNTGYINVYFQEPRTFSEEEVRQLSALGSQAAIAIQSIRLLRDAQARVYREQVLRQVTAQVRSSTNIDTIMQTAVRELGQALGRKTFVALSDEQPESTISD